MEGVVGEDVSDEGEGAKDGSDSFLSFLFSVVCLS